MSLWVVDGTVSDRSESWRARFILLIPIGGIIGALIGSRCRRLPTRIALPLRDLFRFCPETNPGTAVSSVNKHVPVNFFHLCSDWGCRRIMVKLRPVRMLYLMMGDLSFAKKIVFHILNINISNSSQEVTWQMLTSRTYEERPPLILVKDFESLLLPSHVCQHFFDNFDTSQKWHTSNKTYYY